MPTGVQYVDGVDGARKAVREQVMYGADWIKYYSDRREHFGPDGRLHSSVNFTDEESRAIVEEAHLSLTLHFTRVDIRRNGKWLLAALHNAGPLPSAAPANK